jgi:hypothetical protein
LCTRFCLRIVTISSRINFLVRNGYYLVDYRSDIVATIVSVPEFNDALKSCDESKLEFQSLFLSWLFPFLDSSPQSIGYEWAEQAIAKIIRASVSWSRMAQKQLLRQLSKVSTALWQTFSIRYMITEFRNGTNSLQINLPFKQVDDKVNELVRFVDAFENYEDEMFMFPKFTRAATWPTMSFTGKQSAEFLKFIEAIIPIVFFAKLHLHNPKNSPDILLYNLALDDAFKAIAATLKESVSSGARVEWKRAMTVYLVNNLEIQEVGKKLLLVANNEKRFQGVNIVRLLHSHRCTTLPLKLSSKLS